MCQIIILNFSTCSKKVYDSDLLHFYEETTKVKNFMIWNRENIFTLILNQYVFIKKLLLSFSGKMLLLYTKADTVSLYGFIIRSCFSYWIMVHGKFCVISLLVFMPTPVEKYYLQSLPT